MPKKKPVKYKIPLYKQKFIAVFLRFCLKKFYKETINQYGKDVHDGNFEMTIKLRKDDYFNVNKISFDILLYFSTYHVGQSINFEEKTVEKALKKLSKWVAK